MFSDDRRLQIFQRVVPLLREVDPEVHLHDVLLDSTRTQLVFVMQRGEWPIALGMDWLDYVSHRDPELKVKLASGLRARNEAARERLARGEEV